MAMATTTPGLFSLPLSPQPQARSFQLIHLASPTRPRLGRVALAVGGDLLGDFGARDPFPAEIESKFGEKVLGNLDTEHKILIPNVSALSLAQQECSPVVGWRLSDEAGVLKLQCLWKLRDFKCGVELINRIYKVAEAAGHFPNLHLEQPNQIRAELWTASIGGLSMNDFIVAAKIDEIRTSDLVPKKRIWA
ncbi:putative pterin-4-alpha-carbinolamine dehydratase [Vitis vinifera]|uniref:4a-hydroxytetrahydrobiopterin dehydratase n=1 Tax=Vitis vinifera TaxID=29760 RepID=A0A438DUX0_VITVI|nr:putative pterin-4-alpha-carbinolamine dehydratase [Vitis vinifera]